MRAKTIQQFGYLVFRSIKGGDSFAVLDKLFDIPHHEAKSEDELVEEFNRDMKGGGRK